MHQKKTTEERYLAFAFFAAPQNNFSSVRPSVSHFLDGEKVKKEKFSSFEKVPPIGSELTLAAAEEEEKESTHPYIAHIEISKACTKEIFGFPSRTERVETPPPQTYRGGGLFCISPQKFPKISLLSRCISVHLENIFSPFTLAGPKFVPFSFGAKRGRRRNAIAQNSFLFLLCLSPINSGDTGKKEEKKEALQLHPRGEIHPKCQTMILFKTFKFFAPLN